MPAPSKAGAGGKQHMRQRTNALLPLAEAMIEIPNVGFMLLKVSTSADCHGLLTLLRRLRHVDVCFRLCAAVRI